MQSSCQNTESNDTLLVFAQLENVILFLGRNGTFLFSLLNETNFLKGQHTWHFYDIYTENWTNIKTTYKVYYI